nr:uncharacterized protein LOC109398328 [Aedes albopictus]
MEAGHCRTCSGSENFRPFSLYAVAEVTQEVIANMLLDVIGVQVSAEDGLPQHICSDCLIALSLAYTFRKQCYRADAKYRENCEKVSAFPTVDKLHHAHDDSQFNGIVPKEEVDIDDYRLDDGSISAEPNSSERCGDEMEPTEFVNVRDATSDHDSHSMVQPMNDDEPEMDGCFQEQNYLPDSAQRFNQTFNRQAMHTVVALPNRYSASQSCSLPKAALGHLPRSQWTAQTLINRSKKGRLIVEAFASTNILPRKDRVFITHLIVDQFIDEFGKLTREELMLRAAELKCIFPTIEKHIWYQPTFYRDENGKKIKLGRIARGCLHDRNHNYSHTSGLATKFKTNEQSSPSPSRSFVDDAVTEKEVTIYQETKRWFRCHRGQWVDIKERWKATSAVRLHEISKLNGITYQHLLDEYPVLTNNSGYQLVEQDFNFRYPDKSSDLLCRKFVHLRDRVKVLFDNEIPAQGKPLLSLLHRELTEDSRNTITAFLLFFFWPCTSIRLSNGTKWRPSVQDSRDSSFLHLKSLTNYETTLSKLPHRNQLREFPDCPIIIVVGSAIEHIDRFFVRYQNVVIYETESFLKALEIALKIYKAYDISFPIGAAGFWNFLAHMLFDFEPPEDANKARILTLAATLRTQQPA